MGAGPQGFGAPPPHYQSAPNPWAGWWPGTEHPPRIPPERSDPGGKGAASPRKPKGHCAPPRKPPGFSQEPAESEAGSSLCVHGLLSCPSTTSWALREPWCCKPCCPSAPLQEGPTSGLPWPKVGEHPCRAPVPPQHLPCSRRGDASSSEHRPGGRGRGDASSTAPEQEMGRGGLWLLGAW